MTAQAAVTNIIASSGREVKAEAPDQRRVARIFVIHRPTDFVVLGPLSPAATLMELIKLARSGWDLDDFQIV